MKLDITRLYLDGIASSYSIPGLPRRDVTIECACTQPAAVCHGIEGVESFLESGKPKLLVVICDCYVDLFFCDEQEANEIKEIIEKFERDKEESEED